MKNYLLLVHIFLIAYLANAQPDSVSYLSESQYEYKIISRKSKLNGEDSLLCVRIKTKEKPSIFKGWESYALISPKLNLAILNNPNPKVCLYINRKKFTGYVFSKQLKEDKGYRNFQFEGGRLEVVREIDPPGTVKPQRTTPRESTYKIPADLTYKPVLYLYPTRRQEVNVKILLSEKRMIHPYPAYNNGWKVTAQPDGTLKNNQTGKEHYCLFWETEGKPCLEKLTQGFVVEGKQTAAFLEATLERLGLSAKEANEFIIFWLPQMENNAFNAIYFASDEYEQSSQLQITPKPDTQIRVMMMWKPLTHKVNLPEQILPDTPKRKGFVAVEWGGSQVSQLDIDN